MKKQLFYRLLGCLSLIAPLSGLFAQQASDLAVSNIEVNKILEKNSLIPQELETYSLNNNAEMLPLPIDKVNIKITSSFNKSFKSANNVQWYSIDKKNKLYLATFNLGERSTRAVYTKNAGMLYSISQGSENSLQREDRRVIKSNYTDYDITNVLEVNSIGQRVYVANLKDADNIVIVRVQNGQLDELTSFATKLPEKKSKKGRIIVQPTQQ